RIEPLCPNFPLSRHDPYLTSNVKRFGEFNLKLNRPPEPWIKDSVFQQAAGSLRVNSTSKAAAEEAI
ncbi:TPA: hypothetical protein ACHIT1_003082, partial [Pseudomonas aeruginosa]